MEIRSISVFLGLSLTLSATVIGLSGAQMMYVCLDGWKNHGHRCFQFFEDAKTWGRAEKACLGADAHLASVHTYDGQKFIQRLIHSATNGDPDTWIGGINAGAAGKWVWTDGTPVHYTYWAYGKPEGEQENCMLTNFGGDLRWDNAHCVRRLPFVCARQAIVTTWLKSTTLVLSGDLGPAENRTTLIADTEPLNDTVTDRLTIPLNMINEVGVRSFGRCPRDWDEYKGACFKLFNILVPWAEAERRCTNAEAHLASVHSNGEYEFMRRLIWRETSQNSVTWIGGTDERHEGNWKWTDGSYNCYHNWANGQPNGGITQNCMEMNFGYYWQWNDRECGYTRPFMCKKKIY